MDEQLTAFVDHARERGLDLATLRVLLSSAGWKDKDIAQAIAARELDLPVPEPGSTTSARDTFLHVLTFAALYTWIIALIVLLFNFVNLAHPDPAQSASLYRIDLAHSAIRQSLASIVVAFPVFLILWRGLLRKRAAHPEQAPATVRRGLTYLSLFVGAVTLASDVIALIYYLFEGELTARFVLKVVALFVITGAAFLYLALTLREPPGETA